MGHQTLSVSDGARALPLALSEMFDLVVLDILVPELDGMAILGAIRAQRLKVPVVVVTALSSEAERSRALFLGANEYIPKPCRFEQLLGYVHSPELAMHPLQS